MESASEQMIKFLEDKIEDMAITIFDLRIDVKILEDKIEDMAITIFDLRIDVKILTDVIRDLENELRSKE